MKSLFNFIFNNAILFLIIGGIYYIYRQYRGLKDRDKKIREVFDKVLSAYLDKKISEASTIADDIEKEYGHVELIRQEIERLRYTIEKGVNGSINDKVETSNLLNKFKLNKKIEKDRYPNLVELEKIGTFKEEEMASVDNGLAITRKEYNAQAFRYNEKANEFPIEYLTKLLRLVPQFAIFDAPKTNYYEENFEVFEEKEPEINSLASLNREEQIELPDPKDTQQEAPEEVHIEHSDVVLKPTTSIVDNQANEEKGA